MKEFIRGTLHKWKFYKYNGIYLLDSCSDNGYYYEVIPGVFSIMYYPEESMMENVVYDSDLYKELMEVFFCPLKQMNLDTLKDIALQVLNKNPRLKCSTMLGWTPYEDKSKDPNYFDFMCIFPDGNKYTITFNKGNLSVFPGHSDAFPSITLRLPLVTGKIDTQKWANKIYVDKNIVLEYE